jgi:hypothetical protein
MLLKITCVTGGQVGTASEESAWGSADDENAAFLTR